MLSLRQCLKLWVLSFDFAASRGEQMLKQIKLLTVLVFLTTLIFNTALGQSRAGSKETNPKEQLIPDIFYNQNWQKFRLGTKKEKLHAVQSIKDNYKKTKSVGKGLYFLGIMYQELEEPANSLKYFGEALEHYPDSADIYARMGEVHQLRGKTEDALAHFQKALEINENIPSALAFKGIYLYEKEEINRALPLLEKARELKPENAEVLRTLGKIYVAKGLGEQAKEVLEQAVRFNKKDADTQLNLAKAYELLSDTLKAEEHFKKAKSYGKKDETIIEESGYSLARSLFNSGKITEAEKEYKRNIKVLKEKDVGYLELGNLYESLGREKEAVNCYAEAYKLNKDHGDKLLLAGQLCEGLDDFEKAEELYKLLRRNKDYRDQALYALQQLKDARLGFESGQLLDEIRQTGTTDQHIEDNYLAIYALDKSNLEAIDGLMNFYEERGYYDEALKWFRRYNKLQPTSDYNKKTIEKDYRAKLADDNMRLFGTKSAPKTLRSKLEDDELYNLGFYGENDRLQENALVILLKRKNYAEDSYVHYRLLNFYRDRGKSKDALKRVTRMRSLGILSDNEAKSLRDEIRQK